MIPFSSDSPPPPPPPNFAPKFFVPNMREEDVEIMINKQKILIVKVRLGLK